MTSKIISNMKGSPTLTPTPKDAISFKIGEPDFDTPQHIVMAGFHALLDGKTHYAPPQGIQELREAIANKSIKENKIPCNQDNVLVSQAKHAIFSAILSIIDKGDEVILPDPAWVSYVPAIKIAGGKAVSVNLTDKDFSFTPDSLSDAITKKTKLIILNSPSNPTGAVAKKKDLKGISDLAKDHNLLVLSDEIYEKIIYEGKHYSIASFDEMKDRTITINGFSKAYAMTGWRIGWAIAPQYILDNMIKVQQHSITCVAPFVQYAALRALTEKEKSMESINKMVEEFKKRRNILVKELNSIDSFKCSKPNGAFYVFPSFDYNITSKKFSEILLEKARIAINPGTAFGKNGEGHIRFSYATSIGNIKEGLNRIKNIEKDLKKFR